MFTLNVVLPLILAFVAPIKADASSACGFFAVTGSGFDTSSNEFSLFAFPALSSPEDSSTGTPLGVVSGVLTTVQTATLFTLDDGTLTVSGSGSTAPLLKNHTKVEFISGSAPASQFCATVSTSPNGGSPLPLIAINGTIDGNFAVCHNKVVFRPQSAGCKAVDLRMVV